MSTVINPPMKPHRASLPLTLILPVYGRQRELDRALASIARQDAMPREVIVIDDASPHPVGIAAGQGLDIRLIRHDRNRGAAAARNTGLRAAATEWVTFLDSDDFLLDDSLSARWWLIAADQKSRPNPRAVYACGWIDVGEDGRPLGIRWPQPSSLTNDFASGCWFSPGSCVVLNAAAAIAAAGFQDERLGRFEDLDWFLTLGRQGFAVKSVPVAAVAVERKRVQDAAAVLRASRLIREKWGSASTDGALKRRLASYLYLEEAAAFFFAGARMRAVFQLARSLAHAPRLRLQLSPGWTSEATNELPKTSIRRGNAIAG